jgi:hypothetical protein
MLDELLRGLLAEGWAVSRPVHQRRTLSAKKLEKEIARLMEDEDVTKKSGIYPYVLDRDESHLNIRAFSD